MKFNISLEQAMQTLNLKAGFTEKECKTNYRKLMMGIHPDSLGDINPIARKILEDEAKRANIAKEVIEFYLKETYTSNASYRNGNNNENTNNTQEKQRQEREYQEQQERQRREREHQAEQEKQRREREYQEQQERERREREYQEQQERQKRDQEQRNSQNQSNKTNNQEGYKHNNKRKIINIAVKFIFVLWFLTGLLVHPILREYGYELNYLGQAVYIYYLIMLITIFNILIYIKYIKEKKVKGINIVVKFIFILWFLISILVYSFLMINGYKLNNLGQVVYISFIELPMIIFILMKFIKVIKSN